MKKILFISLVSIAMIFVSCGKKAALDTSIPKNAVMVAKFDIKGMALKADYKIFENQTIKAGVEMLKTQLKNDAQKNIFENFQKNPNSFGIDIIGDAYWFMNGQIMGFVLPVNNAQKIYDNLLAFEPSFEQMIEKSGGLYIVSQGGGNIAWDKTRMIILVDYQRFAYGAGEPLNIADYFNLPKDASIVSDKNYQKFASTNADISLYYAFANYAEVMNNFGGIYREINDEMGDLYTKLVEIYKNFDGVSAGISCNFEKGKIVTKVQTLYANAEVEKKFKELYTYSDAKLSGEFFNFVPQNPLFLLAINFDGEKIYSMLEKMGLSEIIKKAQEGNDKFDIKSLISSVKGDLVLSVNNINPTDKNAGTSISLFAKLGNHDAVKSIIDNTISNKIQQPDGSYLLENGFSFGIKDNVFFALYGENAQKLYTEGAENPLAKKAKGQPAFIYGDLTGLKAICQPLYSEGFYANFAPLFDKGLSLCETYESKYIDDNNAELVLNFTDKKQNSLKQIFGFIDEVITSIPTMR